MAPQWPGMLGASVVELADGRWLRAYGTFPHPNILAGFLALGILLAAQWYVRRYHHFDRVLALTCGICASLGLTFSFSRSGGLAAVFGVLVWLLNVFYRRHWQDAMRISRFIGLAFVVAGVAFFVALPAYQVRVSGEGRLEKKSYVERQAFFREGMSGVLEALPIGVGIGHATVKSSRTVPTRPGWDYQPVHNIFLLSLLELGVAGMISVVLIFLGLVWRVVLGHSFVGLGVIGALFI